MIGSDAPVAGKAELERAAERGSVYRSHPGLAAGFKPPVQERELSGFLVEALDRLLLAMRLRHIGKFAAEEFQHCEISAGAERLLAGRDYRALDGALARDPLHNSGKLLNRFEIDEIHRAPGHVPGDERDSVRIDLELEIEIVHDQDSCGYGSPDLCRKRMPRSSRSMTRSISG